MHLFIYLLQGAFPDAHPPALKELLAVRAYTKDSANQSINPSINQSINQSINRSINRLINHSLDRLCQRINSPTPPIPPIHPTQTHHHHPPPHTHSGTPRSSATS